MKISSLLVLTFALTALCLPAIAHPGHSAAPVEKAYLVSWIGIAPTYGADLSPESCPDFYRKAFVSKFAILGASALQ